MLGRDRIAHQTAGASSDQDLAGLGRLLESRRGVHHVPEQRRVGRTHDDLTGGNADLHLQLHAPLTLQRPVESGQPRAHLVGGAQGAQRVVLMQHREAEHADYGISDELLDPAAMLLDRVTHLREILAHHSPEGFRVQTLTQRRRADDVAEHGGDRLSYLSDRRGRSDERGTTRVTEPRPGGVLLVTIGANRHMATLRRLGRRLEASTPSNPNVTVRSAEPGR